MVVHRAVSAGVEGPAKSWQSRFLPIANPAAEALERLEARGDYTSREDYIFCSRLGRRLDPSAVRRRFKAARDAAGLRPLRFHALRHAAGSLIARHADDQPDPSGAHPGHRDPAASRQRRRKPRSAGLVPAGPDPLFGGLRIERYGPHRDPEDP